MTKAYKESDVQVTRVFHTRWYFIDEGFIGMKTEDATPELNFEMFTNTTMLTYNVRIKLPNTRHFRSAVENGFVVHEALDQICSGVHAVGRRITLISLGTIPHLAATTGSRSCVIRCFVICLIAEKLSIVATFPIRAYHRHH